MPYMQITSIVLEKTNVKVGDSIIYEVCMNNTQSDVGDIRFKTGFGYLSGSNIIFLKGYIDEPIRQVLPGEQMCPYERTIVSAEVLAAQQQGKDIKFFALATPGTSMSKDVLVEGGGVLEGKADIFNVEFLNANNQVIIQAKPGEQVRVRYVVQNIGNFKDVFYTRANVGSTVLKEDGFTLEVDDATQVTSKAFIMPNYDVTVSIEAGHWEGTDIKGQWVKDVTKSATVKYQKPEFCTQVFKIQDQDGNPLLGQINMPSLGIDIPVPNTGVAELFAQKGMTHEVTAINYQLNQQQTKTFTTCSTLPVIFTFTVEEVPPPEVEPEVPGKIAKIEFLNQQGQLISKGIEGQSITARVTIQNLSSEQNDFRIIMKANGLVVNEYIGLKWTLNPGESDTVDSNIFVLPDENVVLEVELLHRDKASFLITKWIRDELLTKTLEVKAVEIPPTEGELKCFEHTDSTSCKDAGCYWWEDNTCHSVPEGTTSYIDVYVKPFSWFKGKYEEAVTGTLGKVTEINGGLINLFKGITDFEYKGTEILKDENENVVVIRVFIKEANVATLVGPVAAIPLVPLIVGVIAAVLLTALIGYIIGTDTADVRIIQTVNDAVDETIIKCRERYPNRETSVDEAKAYLDCTGGAETVRIIAIADVTGQDPDPAIATIDVGIEDIKTGLYDGSIVPEDIDKIVEDIITLPTKEATDTFQDVSGITDCAFEVLDQCLITQKGLNTLKLVAIGVGGVILFSVLAPTVGSIIRR